MPPIHYPDPIHGACHCIVEGNQVGQARLALVSPGWLLLQTLTSLVWLEAQPKMRSKANPTSPGCCVGLWILTAGREDAETLQFYFNWFSFKIKAGDSAFPRHSYAYHNVPLLPAVSRL